MEDRTTVHQTCSKQSENHLPGKVGPVHVDFDQCDVAPLQRDELKKFLNEYRDVFANNEKEVGHTNCTRFKINTKNNVPIAVKLRRTLFALHSEVDRQINHMKERRLIEPFNSPYSSPILLVPKLDGSYRFCADFRALDDETITEIFPLPSVRECLDSLQGSTMFTTLDLYSSYWQIPIAKGSRHKIASTMEPGHWQFCVMPFGVKNSPSVFGRLMTDIMQGLLCDGVAVYLDDITIEGSNFQEHLKLLRVVLQRLREAGLTVKSSKVKLCHKQLTFLAHQVSEQGVKPDPDKILAIKGWPTPTTNKEVRAFLGFCNYYSDFIPNL